MNVERLDLKDPVVATELLRLQRSAYSVEARLIGSNAIPPLNETLAELRRAPVEWTAIRSNGALVAAMAIRSEGGAVDIDRLVVDPGAMRRGFGSVLVRSLPDDAVITVSTGTLNQPAHAFYTKHGFRKTGESEPVPGLAVTHLEREPYES